MKNSLSKEIMGMKKFDHNTTRVMSELSRRQQREKRRTLSG